MSLWWKITGAHKLPSQSFSARPCSHDCCSLSSHASWEKASEEKLSLLIFIFTTRYSQPQYATLFDWTFHHISFRFAALSTEIEYQVFAIFCRLVASRFAHWLSFWHCSSCLHSKLFTKSRPTSTSHGDKLNIYKICKHWERWERCDNWWLWIFSLCGWMENSLDRSSKGDKMNLN